MAGLRDILNLTWVNMILLTAVGVVIAGLSVNSFYFYKKSRDIDNKMTSRWNDILLWVNIVLGLLLMIFALYFIWKIFANVVESRPLTDIFEAFNEMMKRTSIPRIKPVQESYNNAVNQNSETDTSSLGEYLQNLQKRLGKL